MISNQEVLYKQRTDIQLPNQTSLIKNHRLSLAFCCYFQRIISLFSTVLLSVMIPSLVWATDLSVFGPETFVRSSGKPIVVERSFNIVNPLPAYTLQITNGGLQDGTTITEYVSSSEIYLNGLLIVGPDNFNQNVQNLSVPISLQASNTLTIELRGKPGGQLSISIVRDQNNRPTANAGQDQTVYIGDLVQLSGSNSTDIDGDPLTYFWTLTETPEQSQTTLNSNTILTPELLIDSTGRYLLDLVVNDGFEDSVADQVIIDTLNSAPVADAGLDQTGFVNSTVTLDGSNSQDVDNDFLSYLWHLIEQPVGSQSVVQNANTAVADITIDKPGHYIAELVVNDGNLDSSPDQVAVDTLNSAPIAATGVDQAAFVGDEVFLEGIDSYDIDGDSLSYSWSLLSKPANSSVILLDANTVQSRFTPDLAGLYIAQLIVQDFELASDPKTTTITITVRPVNHHPTILSTPGTTVITGDDYIYSVSAQDQDGDSLSYRLAASPDDMTIDSSGTLNWIPQAAGTYSIIIEVTDGIGGLATQSFSIVVSNPIDEDLPPDPASVAPELNSSEFTTFTDSTAFLYIGDNPIQTNVVSGTIEASRVAIIRGKVLDNDNQPLTGVTIQINGLPELGQTLSRANGEFDMAVNGGGLLTINYTKTGYLPVQRKVQTPWKDFAHVVNVVMIPLDDKATLVDLANTSQPFQIAQGSINTDADGSRQTTVLFPQGTTAIMTLADGTTQALTTMTVRATEYTVGENGPKRMPGPLPTASGYTFAVELSVDEALAAGANTVTFNQKVPFYVDNFLNFPVGEIVPVGYYDREKAAWIPSQNGKVIKIINISNGIANLDVTGDDIIDTGETLTGLGITIEEQTELASLYTTGKSFWRVQIDHFTPWDCNWPFGPPAEAKLPPGEEPKIDKDEQPDVSCEESGCVIQIENQVLGEDFSITGSALSLHYRSDRVPGRSSGRAITIPLTDDTIPDSLIGIKLIINIAGQTINEEFPVEANQTKTFIWNGLDAFGREIPQATATIQIEHVYPAQYYAARENFDTSFALAGDSTGSIIGSRQNATVSTVRTWKKQLSFGNNVIPSAELGNLTVNVHHAFNAEGQTLSKGDGSSQKASSFGNIKVFAGTGEDSSFGDGSPAINAGFQSPQYMTFDDKNNLYITDTARVRKISADGIISAVAGNGQNGFFNDGGPAINAGLTGPAGLAFDSKGNLYISQSSGYRIRKVSQDGIITTIAGTGEGGFNGDGGPATAASFNVPYYIVFDREDNLYIADSGNNRIRKVSADGIITTIAGTGENINTGDNGLAIDAGLRAPQGLAIDSIGNLYVSTNNTMIRKISTDGIITTIVGRLDNSGVYSGDNADGKLATDVSFRGLLHLFIDTKDNLFFSDQWHLGVFRLTPDGLLVQENETPELINNFARYKIRPEGIAVDQHDNLYIANSHQRLIRKVSRELFNFGSEDILVDSILISKDGRELFKFDKSGRHLETRDALTNDLIYNFTYESNGYLSTIINREGEINTIERLVDGTPVAIIAPDGERTEITLDNNGYAKTITNQAGETHQLTYLEGGLLDIYTDPNGNSYDYDYDIEGRLIDDKSPTGAGWELAITEQTENSRTVTKTSKEGRKSTYKFETLATEEFIRTITNPDNTTIVSLQKKQGETITTQANGTVVSITEGPDPRFDMAAPIPKKGSITLPSGLSSTFSTTSTAVLSDLSDIFSLTQLTNTITENDKTSTSVYDATNKTITSTSAQGRTGSVLLDAKGRPIESHITGLNPINTEYDSRGRIQHTTIGSGTEQRQSQYSYYQIGPMKGYLQTITDALGQTSGFEYDLSGRITQQTLPDARKISYEYDANGNLARLIPAGRPAHDFGYDGLDQEVSYLPPELLGITNPITTYAYNKDRQLTLITRPDGNTITPIYNLISGKLDSLITPIGQTSYEYHATSGQLNNITTPDNQQLNFTYDGFLPKTINWTGEINGTVSQTYNSDFNLSSRNINGNHNISYSYDNDQLLTQAGELILNREAQKGGLLNGTALGLQTTSQSYTAFAELQHSSASYNGIEQISHQYSYDKLSRIKTKTETIAGISHAYEYDYDITGRLISVKKDNTVTETYQYDSNNNRTHKNGAAIATYDNQDRLLTYQNNSYTYTENGELKTKTNSGATTNYSYDALGNLRQVTLPGDITIDYLIDGQNRRIGKKVNGQIKQGFLYKDQLNPIAELDENGAIIARFVYAEKSHVPSYLIKIDPLTQVETTYRVISDHLGSPRLIINTDDASIAQRIDYDTWGNVTNDTNPGFQPFGFAGGIYDLHTNLVRFGVRDYDAEAGRWTAKDPIRFEGEDSNLYAYVGNDPVNFIDPTGLCPSTEPTQPTYTGDPDLGIEPVCVVCYVYPAYKVGKWIKYGKEFHFGNPKNFRIAPFGNRNPNWKSHKTGKWPHYHRKGVNKKGTTKPGQSIKRHRPWDKSPSDKSWKDRF